MSRISIRPLEQVDLSFGYGLSVQAGWNQLRADWERVFALDRSASFVASWDGVDVGTVTAVVFDTVAWVGLMLVDPAARGQGVGRALMERVLDMLDARSIQTIRLDATPLGLPLYEKLGFRADFALQRYGGVLSRDVSSVAAEDDVSVVPATTDDLAPIADLDEQITSTRRRKFLERLMAEFPRGAYVARRGGRLSGFVLARAGRLGTLVGPCLSEAATGAALLSRAIKSLLGMQVLVDIPDDHAAARALVANFGLASLRPLTRMTRGRRIAEDIARIWASSGPEKG